LTIATPGLAPYVVAYGGHDPYCAIRHPEQTPVNLIFVAAAGLWHNLFNKPGDSAT
jgi:hypothetical protein